jgi:GTP-binding protein HflX
MFEIKYPPPAERIVLSGLYTSQMDPDLFEEDMQEMVMLSRTAGAKVLEIFIQRGQRPNATTYIGKGKLQEIQQYMRENDCKTLVIDAELTPGQIRNIEKVIDGKVIDRSQLILDIFAQHARTNEARIQVELAQLRTLYPRLTHAWSHFSQQVGGIGTRGPGEKQLEVDRRLVQNKIADLKRLLMKVERSRIIQRKRRKEFVRLVIIGYTNVGKSSLLNALSGSSVLVENKLFATLDTATRRTYIPGTGTVVISDTVGFLRKLPHHLVASFKSTLEVVTEADILLIVMDASSTWSEQQLTTVNEVCNELGVDTNHRLIVFNKIDLITSPFERKKLSIAFPDSPMVSAFNPDDMQKLKERIRDIIGDYNRDKAMSAIITRQTKRSKEASKLPGNFI